MTVEALWLAYAALGGAATLPGLTRYLADGTGFTSLDHDYVAQALNDRYLDLSRADRVPYSESFEEFLR